MKGTGECFIKLPKVVETYSLDMNKINTIDDIKIILEGLDIKIIVKDGVENKQYEALKKYLK